MVEEQIGSQKQRTFRQVALLVVASIGFFSIALFAPDSVPHRGAFFQPALQTTWRNVLDLPAVWSSVKIMLFCIGLFLMIESTGTMLTVFKMRTLAITVFFLQLLPGLGIVCGAYYLLKSLL